MNFTNKANLSFPAAAMLYLDEYDYNDNPWHISATTLMRSVKSIILTKRHSDQAADIDLISRVPSTMGTAMHSLLEKAMDSTKVLRGVSKLFSLDHIPKIIMEKRSSATVGKWTVSGKFDLCLDNQLIDLKTCSVWSDIFDSSREDYILQGSIYRWLNPDLNLTDMIQIEKWFTDWQKKEAAKKREYPQHRVISKFYPLMSCAQTENWITSKLAQIEKHFDLPENQIPACTPEELWETQTKYKVFKTEKSTRAMNGGVKNTRAEAEAFLASKNGNGVITTFPGQVKRCNWCSAINVCDQAKAYIQSGQLIIED